YRPRVSHAGTVLCGVEAGNLCIDLPGTGCPVSNPAITTTLAAAGECCDATPTATNPVCAAGANGGAPCTVDSECPGSTCRTSIGLICDPATCDPAGLPDPGFSTEVGRFVPYIVNFADVSGPCAAGNVRASAIYDNGISHQSTPDVIPAQGAVPICNPVPTATATST